MKTLRNTIVLALLAIGLYTTSANAQANDDNAYVRSQLVKLFEQSDISEMAVVDLNFLLVNNHIKVKSVKSGQLQLDKKIAKYLDNKFLKQPSSFFSFNVRVNLNGASMVDDKTVAQNSLRFILTDMLEKSAIYEKGEATIHFKVTKDQQLEVINIDGKNPVLASKIKAAIDLATLEIPKDANGLYAIKVKF